MVSLSDLSDLSPRQIILVGLFILVPIASLWLFLSGSDPGLPSKIEPEVESEPVVEPSVPSIVEPRAPEIESTPESGTAPAPAPEPAPAAVAAPSPSDVPGQNGGSPINCEGSWSDYGDWSWLGVSESQTSSEQPNLTNPYNCGPREKIQRYSITTSAQNGGQECQYNSGDTRNSIDSTTPSACSCNFESSVQNINSKDSNNYLGSLNDQSFTMDPPPEPSSPPIVKDLKDYFEISSYPNYEIGPRSHSEDGQLNKMNINDYNTNKNNLFNVNCFSDGTYNFTDSSDPPTESTPFIPHDFPNNYLYCKENNQLQNLFNSQYDGLKLTNPNGSFSDLEFNLSLNYNSLDEPLSWNQLGLNQDKSNYSCPANHFLVDKLDTSGRPIRNPFCGEQGLELPYECVEYCTVNSDINDILIDADSPYSYQDGMNLDNLRSSVESSNKRQSETFSDNTIIKCADGYSGEPILTCGANGFFTLSGCTPTTCATYSVSTATETGDHLRVDPSANNGDPCYPNCGRPISEGGCLNEQTTIDCSDGVSPDICKIFSVSTGSHESTQPQDLIANCCDTSKLRNDLSKYINNECNRINPGYIINPYYSEDTRLNSLLINYRDIESWNNDSSDILNGNSGLDQDKLISLSSDTIKKPICIPGPDLKCPDTCTDGKISLSNKYINQGDDSESKCCYTDNTTFTYGGNDLNDKFFSSGPSNSIEFRLDKMNQVLNNNRTAITTDVNNSGINITQDKPGIFRSEDISICNNNSLLLSIDDPSEDLSKTFNINNCNSNCKISNKYFTASATNNGRSILENDNLLNRYASVGEDNFKDLIDNGPIYQEILSEEPEIIDTDHNKSLNVLNFNNAARRTSGICGGVSSRDEASGGANIFCSQFSDKDSCNRTDGCSSIYKCPQYSGDPPSLSQLHNGKSTIEEFGDDLWYTKPSSSGETPNICPIYRLHLLPGRTYGDNVVNSYNMKKAMDDSTSIGVDIEEADDWKQTTNSDIETYRDICGDGIDTAVEKVYSGNVNPQIFHFGDDPPDGRTCEYIGCGPENNNTEKFYINDYSYLSGLISNFSDTPDYGAINDNDTGYHGLYGICKNGEFKLRGCDIRVDMNKTDNNDSSNPLFLYKSSISRNGNENYEPCSDFIDYETITYDYINNTITPEITHAVDSPQGSSNTEAYTLCSNQDNVVFYPHLDNQACSPGFYPINNVNILNGDQIYENCTGNSATDCNSDFCRWNGDTCEKLNKARCKEIVEQGTQESISPGGTYIHSPIRTDGTNNFGNYSNYYTDCPDSFFTELDSPYKSKSFYESINITKDASTPDFYTKNVDVGNVPTMINRMNCNSNKDLFNDNHEINTSLLNDQPGNLRFRFHKENDLELINNSMGSDTSLNLCSPGNILTLEDTPDTNNILNFTCSPCPLPDNSGLNPTSKPICYRNPMTDSSNIPGYFNDNSNIQIQNIIPDTTSSTIKMCDDGHIYSYDSSTRVGQCIPRTCTVNNMDGIIKNTTGQVTNYNYGGEEFNLYEQAVESDLIEGFGYSNNTPFDVNENPVCSGNKDILKNTCKSIDTCTDETCLTIGEIYEPDEINNINPETKIIDSLSSENTNSIIIDNPCSNFNDATQYKTKEECVNNNENNVWVPFKDSYYNSLNQIINNSNLNDSIEQDGVSGICLSLNKYKDSDEINSLLNSGILPDRDLLDKNTSAKQATIDKLFDKKGVLDILSYKNNLIDSFNTNKTKCASSFELWGENVEDNNYNCSDICTKRTGNNTTDTCSISNKPFSNSINDKDSIEIFNMMKADYINCDKYIIGDFKNPPKDISDFDKKDNNNWYKQWESTLDFNTLPSEMFSTEVLNKTDTGNFEFSGVAGDGHSSRLRRNKDGVLMMNSGPSGGRGANFTTRTNGCYYDINYQEAIEMCNQSNTCAGFYTNDQWNDEASKRNSETKARVCFKSGYNDPSYPLDESTRNPGTSSQTFFTKQNTDKPYCSMSYYDNGAPKWNSDSELEYERNGKPIDWETSGFSDGICVCPPNTYINKQENGVLWRCLPFDNHEEETKIEFPYIYNTYDLPACTGSVVDDCSTLTPENCSNRHQGSVRGLQCFLDEDYNCTSEITKDGEIYNKLCTAYTRSSVVSGSGAYAQSTICMIPDKEYENNCSSKPSYPDVPSSKYHEDNEYDYLKYDNTIEFYLKDGGWTTENRMLPDFPSTEIINQVGGGVYDNNKSCISNINLEDAQTICNNSKTCYGFWTFSDGQGVNTGKGMACFKYGYGDPLWDDENLDRKTRSTDTFYKKEKFSGTSGTYQDYVSLGREFNNDSIANSFKLCPCNSNKCPTEPNINTTDILDLPLTKMTDDELNQLNNYSTNNDINGPGVSTYFDKLTDIMGNEMNPEINVFTKGYDPNIGNHFDRNAYTGCIPIDEPEMSTCVERDAYQQHANSDSTDTENPNIDHGNRLWITGNTPMNTYEPGPPAIINDKELINWYNNVDTCGWIMHFGDITEDDKKEKLKNKYSRICNRQIYKGNEAKTVHEYVTPGGDFSYDDGHSSNIGSFSSTPEIVSDMMKEEGVGDVKNQMIPQYYKYYKSDLSSINQEMKPNFVDDNPENDTYKSLCTSQLSQDGETLVCSYNVMFDSKRDVQDGTVTDTTTSINDINQFPDKGLLKTNYSQRASLLQPYFGYLSNTDGSTQNTYLENKNSDNWSSAFGDTFDRVPTIDYFYSNIDDLDKIDNYYTTKQNSPAGGELDNNYEEGQSYPVPEGFSGNKKDNDFKKPKGNIECGWKNHVWHDIKDSYNDDLVHQYINDHYKDICTGIPATVSSVSDNIMTYSDIWLVPDTCMPRTETERKKIGTCPDCKWGEPETFLGPDGGTTGLSGNPKDPSNYYNDGDIPTRQGDRPTTAKDGLGTIMNARSDFAHNNRGFCAPCPPNTALTKVNDSKLICAPVAVNEYVVNPSFYMREIQDFSNISNQNILKKANGTENYDYNTPDPPTIKDLEIESLYTSDNGDNVDIDSTDNTDNLKIAGHNNFHNSKDFYFYNGLNLTHSEPDALNIYLGDSGDNLQDNTNQAMEQSGYLMNNRCGGGIDCHIQDKTSVDLWDDSGIRDLNTINNDRFSNYIQHCPAGWQTNSTQWNENIPNNSINIKTNINSPQDKKTSFGLIYSKQKNTHSGGESGKLAYYYNNYINNKTDDNNKKLLSFTMNQKADSLLDNENIRTSTCGSVANTSDPVITKSGWSHSGNSANSSSFNGKYAAAQIRQDNYISRYDGNQVPVRESSGNRLPVGDSTGTYYRDKTMEWPHKCTKDSGKNSHMNSTQSNSDRSLSKQTCYDCSDLKSVQDTGVTCSIDSTYGCGAGNHNLKGGGLLNGFGVGTSGYCGSRLAGHNGCFSGPGDGSVGPTCSSNSGDNAVRDKINSGVYTGTPTISLATPTIGYGSGYKIGNATYIFGATDAGAPHSENSERCRGSTYGEDSRCDNF